MIFKTHKLYLINRSTENAISICFLWYNTQNYVFCTL